MPKRPGKVIQFTDKSGTVQKGIAYNDEQSPEFAKVKRLFIRHINDDYTFKRDETQRKICSLKFIADVKLIGFVD